MLDAAETNNVDCCCVIQVQEAVHGVTLEECQAALQNHNWNVQKAVHYLKVRAFISPLWKGLMDWRVIEYRMFPISVVHTVIL